MIKFIPLVSTLGDVKYCNIESIDMVSPHRDEGLIVCFKNDDMEMHVIDDESCDLLDQLIKENVYKLHIEDDLDKIKAVCGWRRMKDE